MSHRRRKGDKKRLEAERKQRDEEVRKERRRDSTKKLGYVAIVLALLFAAAVLFVSTPPNYMQCFPPGTAMTDRGYTYVYIGIGNWTDYKFVRIPDSMGQMRDCSWPLQTYNSKQIPSERTEHYAKVHTLSPYSHTYNLGNFFYVWGEATGMGGPVYFGDGGVSTYRGHVAVYIYGEQTPAENLTEQPQYLWGGPARDAPLNGGQFVYVHLEWPYTNTTVGVG